MSYPNWSLSAGELGCKLDPISLRVYPADPSALPIRSAPLELAPSLFCLYEWIDYRLKIINADKAYVQQGAIPIAPDRDGFFAIRYTNTLGRSLITIKIPGIGTVELPVEILSPNKYPEPEQYLTFYSALLTDLSRQAPALPFEVAAPTSTGVAESTAPTSPLFILNFFRQYSAELCTALDLIRSDPHRHLLDEIQWPHLAQANDVNEEVVVEMITHPEHLAPAPQRSWPLVKRLNGRAPLKVFQRVGRETFDTAENRFVRMAVHTFQHTLGYLRRHGVWQSVPVGQQAILNELDGRLVEFANGPLFDEVGQMALFPASSLVLQRRDGYRELAHLWRIYQLARRPFFGDLQTAMDVRNVAYLYEFWCFFQLIDLLKPIFGSPVKNRIFVTDLAGLEYEAVVMWPDDVRLVYNRRHGAPHSYSTALHPDYVLLRPGQPGIIFDAKFRFTVDEWDRSDEDPVRNVQKTDLYKMHTYRDALQAQGAIVLYPGDRPVFYDIGSGKMTASIDLATALKYSGVGALCLEPGVEVENAAI